MHKVRVEVVNVPTSYLDVKSGKAKTKKILNGVSQSVDPFLDRNGRVVTGVTKAQYDEIIKDDDDISEPLTYREFYSKFSIKIDNQGLDLDLSIPKHKLMHALLLASPDVSNDEKSVNTAIHTFLLRDEEQEATKIMSAIESKMTAYSYMSNMNPAAIKGILVLYGKDASEVSDVLAKAKLGEFIEKNPKKFIAIYEDNNKVFKINLQRLVNGKILRKDGRAYYYGEDGDAIFLGGNEELAVQFLKDDKNQELYVQLLQILGK